MFKRIGISYTHNTEEYIHNWEYAHLYACAKKKLMPSY